MKALSTWQPWAGLLAIGAKEYETRSWATRYRGVIAIHAGLRWNEELREWQRVLLHNIPLGFMPPRFDWRPVAGSPPALGCLLGTARLVDCVPTQSLTGVLSRHEIQMGDFGPCRFAWRFDDARPFDEPIPCRGKQGLFDVDLSTLRRKAVSA